MKKLITLIILILLYSCGSKKVITEYKDVIVKDTIIEFKDRIVTKAIKDTLFVDNPCDSLGILKPFKQSINTGSAKVVIENVNGNIQATVNIDSLVNERIEKYKSNFKQDIQIKTKEVTKYRMSKWGWFSILFNGILILVILLMLKRKLL